MQKITRIVSSWVSSSFPTLGKCLIFFSFIRDFESAPRGMNSCVVVIVFFAPLREALIFFTPSASLNYSHAWASNITYTTMRESFSCRPFDWVLFRWDKIINLVGLTYAFGNSFHTSVFLKFSRYWRRIISATVRASQCSPRAELWYQRTTYFTLPYSLTYWMVLSIT